MASFSLRTAMDWSGMKEIYIDRFPFTVGRHRDSDCRVPFVFVSRHHCSFYWHNDRILVQDLESHNGTLVNGCRIQQPTCIKHGDEISMGPLRFRVVMHTTMVETGVEFSFVSTGILPTMRDDQSTPHAGFHPFKA